MFSSGKTDIVVDYICNQLFEDNHDWCAEEEYEDDNLVYILPPLHYVWLDEAKCHQKKKNMIHQCHQN